MTTSPTHNHNTLADVAEYSYDAASDAAEHILTQVNKELTEIAIRPRIKDFTKGMTNKIMMRSAST